MPICKSHRNGRTSYTWLLRLESFVKGLASFSIVPLNLMVGFGMLVSLISFAFGIFVILEKLVYNPGVGWASLIVSIWFIGGAIVFCLGVIGIYVSRIFVETKAATLCNCQRNHQSGRHD